jgi:hypothetical protein
MPKFKDKLMSLRRIELETSENFLIIVYSMLDESGVEYYVFINLSVCFHSSKVISFIMSAIHSVNSPFSL